jgi:aldehyde:ferredoxin oxidoreductase
MKGGYTGKILYVDLTKGKISEQSLPEEKVLRDWLGNWGLGLRMLYDMVPPGIRAKDPENPMIFMNGPMTGVNLPGGNQLSLATKNFNNGFVGRSHTHGRLGTNLKRAGYDGMIITGASEKPVYLYINDEGADLRDASHIWGKLDSHETEDILLKEHGKTASVGSIGPFGENHCAGGMILNDENHNMAHSGVGSVMGSKMLKAYVIQSDRKDVPIAHPKKINDIRKRWVETVRSGNRYGRSGKGLHFRENFRFIYKGIGFAGRNFTISDLPAFGMGLSEQKITSKGCRGCPHICPVDIEVQTGPRKGFVATISGGGEGPESAGALIGITDVGDWLYILDLYDRLGVEASWMGCTIAMAIEAFEKGIITQKDTDGLELKWGNADVIEKLVRKASCKEGFGRILALGPLGAARAIGGGAENFAVHLKGSSLNMHDWRTGWGMLLSHLVGSGAGWGGSASDSTGPEPDAGYPALTPPFDYRNKPEEARKAGIIKFMKDCVGSCGLVTWQLAGMNEILRDAVNAVTGWDFTVEELLDVGERVMQAERCFNIRHGMTPADDHNISPRLLEAPNDGKAAGRAIGPYIHGMIDEYYDLMGWDKHTGKPWRATLKQFGLDDMAKDLWD